MAVNNGKKNLLQILGEKGKIKREVAVEAMRDQQANPGKPLEDILIEKGVPELDVFESKAALLQVPFFDGSSFKPEAEARGLLPEDLQARHKAIPVMLDGKKLTVVMGNPRDVFAIDEMRQKTGCDIVPVLTAPSHMELLRNAGASQDGASPEATEVSGINSEIEALLGGLAPVEKDPTKKQDSGAQGEDEDPASRETNLSQAAAMSKGDMAEGVQLADEAPIIRIVNTILMYAIRDGASDIHIEPQRKGVRVRYRIDGVLHEQMKVPQYVLNPLVSRIKIMADLNIAERRVPQDGRIHVKMQDKDFDLRVSTCPSQHGEKIVMRILDKSSVMIGLEKLGLYPETQEILEDICAQPNGMFLISGPTGSGKTTTLYSALNVVNSVEKNTMTVEDPVEYQLPGLTQVNINRKAGLTFANSLRSFLRQDPDIIMIGETRDLETAEIAVQAALTGHLVLTTIHTNDAPSIATRLVDMGVEPFLIAASMVAGLAQRLTRKICQSCKEEYVPQRELLLRFGFDPKLNPDVKFWHGAGCDACRQSGYKGRLGVYEMMRVNEELAEMIVRRAPLSEIKEAAKANGMHTMQEDGFRKCRDGLTTIEEVMRVVFTSGH
ncbi:MAG: GspE/PulE family protein [Abditibacteriaceae bacterium]